jgi:hypothetical protein
MDSRKYSAYNKTRASSLDSEVTVVDAALEPLKVMKVLMEGVGMDAEGGVWLTHFTDLPVGFRLAAFDLVYLDENNRVVEGVELLPDVPFTPFTAKVASALVLPLGTFASSQAHRGDQLLICPVDELESQFALPSAPAAPAPVTQATEPPAEPPPRVVSYAPPPSIDRPRQVQAPIQRLEPPKRARSRARAKRSLRDRFLRWLYPEANGDRRRAARHPLPELVAYYWTGGAPRPYKVGDISDSGFYLLTEDRWTPGTIVQMILQRAGTRGEAPDDAISVPSKVVRSGLDGEGLEFILSEFMDLKSGRVLQATKAYKDALGRFLRSV